MSKWEFLKKYKKSSVVFYLQKSSKFSKMPKENESHPVKRLLDIDRILNFIMGGRPQSLA